MMNPPHKSRRGVSVSALGSGLNWSVIVHLAPTFMCLWVNFQCSRRLIQSPSLGASSASKTLVPKNLRAIEELATEQVLLAYGNKGAAGTLNRDVAIKWMTSR